MIRLVVAAAIFLGPASTGLAADCPAPDRAPRIEIGIDEGGVAYDFTLTRAQLVALPHKIGATAPDHGGAPQGLTFNTLKAEVEAGSRYRDVGPGLRCIYPERVAVKIVVDQRIYVDRRYAEGSCERQAILEHELEHVRINRVAAHGYEARLRDTVADLLARHPYSRASSNQALQRAYLEPVRDLILPMLDRIRATALAHHAELDAPASYAATHAKCRHW